MKLDFTGIKLSKSSINSITESNKFTNLLEDDSILIEGQEIYFDLSGKELFVTFDIEVVGRIKFTSGDYFTEDQEDISIESINVIIDGVYYEEEEIELSVDDLITLSKIIKSNI